MYPKFSFKVKDESKESNARTAQITTPHGVIQTPAFIFCGTMGIMLGCTSDQLKANKSQIMLSNTYHLYIHPGHHQIKKMGGLHKVSGWDGPMLTDSGGYQIFAMGHGSVSKEIKGSKNHTFKPTLQKIKEEGAVFRSYRDQSQRLLTPELSIEIQRNLGADIILVFDECTPYNVDKAYTKASMERSHRWATRSLQEFKKHNNHTQALYGIVQGSVYEDLRKISCEFNNSQDYFGIAVGGSLGDSKEMMYKTVKMTMSMLDNSKRPIHLLGIGGISDIFNGVKCGIDTFDCVHPSRIARHGCALFKPSLHPHSKGREHLDLTKGRYKDDHQVIDQTCRCTTCKGGDGITRSTINYFLSRRITTAGTLITNHNVYFMNRLMEDIRTAIAEEKLDQLEMEYIGDKVGN